MSIESPTPEPGRYARKTTLPVAQRATLTLRTACEFSGLSRATLHRKMSAGELAFTKCGGRRLIIVASLLRMLGIEQSEAA